MLTETSGQDT